ncbi:hypothetical protein M3O96_09835 [Aquiflexum sp. TKW24L]|uniref:hypothetical protein n=1 Tax=Aquiflexum sp. TKW24L TaxID=2942212 RepID=UPI0020C0ABE7|nr:hypothetical protein [Aquiflexum sp. TKW24L]MCL6259389.1 hypothetical protein [Aquiflexum sp. TKW24L]
MTQAATVNTRNIIFGMIMVFIIVHIGFHATYIQYFPTFEEFTWLHHIHGALMASWVFLLVLQPVLILYRKFAVHRFFGKLSYVIAPLMIISMLIIARVSYHRWDGEYGSVEVFSWQSVTWMQLLMFGLFYSLAIYYKKNTFRHMRFMIGTAIIMIGPSLSRIINAYLDTSLEVDFELIPLYFKTGLAAALLSLDLIKKKDWMPYSIVLLAFLFADLVYYARYSEAWQSFGRFVVKVLY